MEALRDCPLPLEILLHIMQCLLPRDADEILPATSDVTKTLLGLSRTCRALHPTASAMLRRHCMCIDSKAKARRLARLLEDGADGSGGRPGFPGRLQVSQMFLAPFPSPGAAEVGEDGSGWARQDDDFDEMVDEDKEDDESTRSPLDDPPTAEAVRVMLKAFAPSLRRLVIDMPLRQLYPDEDRRGVRRTLRDGFEALAGLEELTSIRDELFLAVHPDRSRGERPVWATCWPRLRRLALYNQDLSGADIWHHMCRHPSLEMAVFARPDMDQDALPGSFDVKSAWFDACRSTQLAGKQAREGITLVFVDCGPLQPSFGVLGKLWRAMDPKHAVRVLLADVPPSSSGGRDEEDCADPISLTQAFLVRHGLRGSLFDEAAMAVRPAVGDD
ncbi:hypothetical protein CDD83_9833 [Cordyceps sp. RAO-2017]|nr:hypothetical protein CDD83_9833 [Cordyceps sp. RAO-2017]